VKIHDPAERRPNRDEREAQEAEWLASLADHAGWQLVVRDLGGRAQGLRQRIVSGKLSHEEYVALCGELRGLQAALDLPLEGSRQAQESPEA
jgi:hypothetical protein